MRWPVKGLPAVFPMGTHHVQLSPTSDWVAWMDLPEVAMHYRVWDM